MESDKPRAQKKIQMSHRSVVGSVVKTHQINELRIYFKMIYESAERYLWRRKRCHLAVHLYNYGNNWCPLENERISFIGKLLRFDNRLHDDSLPFECSTREHWKRQESICHLRLTVCSTLKTSVYIFPKQRHPRPNQTQEMCDARQKYRVVAAQFNCAQ